LLLREVVVEVLADHVRMPAAQARIVRRSSEHLGEKRSNMLGVLAVHMRKHRRENRVVLDPFIESRRELVQGADAAEPFV